MVSVKSFVLMTTPRARSCLQRRRMHRALTARADQAHAKAEKAEQPLDDVVRHVRPWIAPSTWCEVPEIALFGLGAWKASLVGVLDRGRRIDHRRIDDGPLATLSRFPRDGGQTVKAFRFDLLNSIASDRP